MRNYVLAVIAGIAFLLAAPMSAQTVLLSENFDGAWTTTNPPAGWQIVFTGDTSTNDWHRQNGGTAPWMGNPTGYACLSSSPGESGADTIMTPAIDCSGYEFVTLRCSTFFSGSSSIMYTAQLVGSVGGGAFDHVVFDYNGAHTGPALQTFDLDWAIGQSNVRLAWSFNGGTQRIDYWAIDDVSVIGSTFIDAEARSIITPSGLVQENSMVTPIGVIANNGTNPATVVAAMTILASGGSVVYDDSTTLAVPVGGVDTIEFSDWTAQPAGHYAARLRVTVAGDVDSTNDAVTDSFRIDVLPRDVGTSEIVAPIGAVYPVPTIPQAAVHNYGMTTETFWARFTIKQGLLDIYSDTAQATALGAGQTETLSFRSFAPFPGNFTAACSTMLAGDINDANDLLVEPFAVETLNFAPGWHEVAHVPLQPGNKDVKGGGSLVTMAATGRIYALKGDKTYDFFSYDAVHDSWTSRASVPPGNDKPVSDGGTLASDGSRFIFATKGNNTRSFYKYDIVLNRWTELDSVPLGVSNKKVKGGASAAFVSGTDADYVYLLKGYKSEFYRYDVVHDSWTTLEPAPTGGGEKYDKGSFIVYNGAGTIYVHQSKYHKMYAFDLASMRWLTTELQAMPLLNGRGRSKKSKDGAAATWYNGSIYALKGGGTCEFWRYTAARDSWQELDTMPSFGSTNKKKYVKAGGSIALYGPDVFVALKGNKTHEAWRYKIPGTIGIEEPSLVGIARRPVGLAVWPVPARAGVTLRLGADCPLPATLRVYDARGALRLEQTAASTIATLDCRTLPSGAYFVRVVGTGESAQFIVE